MKAKLVKESFDVELTKGFSDSEFETYVYNNMRSIRDNMKRYGISMTSLYNMKNYFDFANVLGIDTRVVKDVDLQYYTLYLYDLIKGEMDDDEFDEEPEPEPEY